MISEEFTMRIQPQRQSGGLLFLHRGSFLLFGRGAGGFFFLLPRSVFRLRGVWRHISPSPRVLPPLPPLKTAKLASEGGEGHGGKEKYAARLPSDRRCQFLKGYSGSESGGRQFLRDHNVAERSRSAMLIPDEITADTPRTGVRNCNGHIAKNIARRL